MACYICKIYIKIYLYTHLICALSTQIIIKLHEKILQIKDVSALLLLTLSWGMRGQEKVIFSEDFSSIKAGDNTTSGGSSTSLSSLNGFSNLTKCYSAGGAIRLGMKDAVGSITTNTLDLSENGGKFKVSIDVKGWSSVEGQIKITPRAFHQRQWPIRP